ncbi:ribosomal protein S18-alanine N-acetyltransferase [Salinicola rhizosphaerae]|uniref:N-acetyltransferase domain-containing protein n=1 Tax=Salinicola rhizosphaerae TaxID=1443141 RepID=A0ABQ3DYA9_9GAMM|nr:ribosomal protein S18-alanine N-acetyltransferase [Salinicola rhizosphaerae]GHB19635.1 hypothetical protein GCM10009038_17910 [Salinicola rhizosphaerae]
MSTRELAVAVLPALLQGRHLDSLMALERLANDDAWSAALLDAALADRDVEVWGVWDASRSNLMAAAVVAYLPFDAELQSICVAPDARRRGVARSLLEWVIDSARARNAERMLLELRASNVAARALYERMGFGVDGQRRGYYRREDGSSEDAVLMSRPLDSRETGTD